METKEITNEDYVTMMNGYIDTAKGVIQLATASLVLPILFLREIVGVTEGKPLDAFVNFYLKSSWLLLLVSIGLGLFYQSRASNRIEQKLDGTFKKSCLPSCLYNSMFGAFFLGIALFLIWAIGVFT